VGKNLERELDEAGVPEDQAPELADLARELEGLPDIKPRRAWLNRAKRRLLDRFDQRKGPPPAKPTE